MNYEAMLASFEWNLKKGTNELEKLDKILASLRRSLLKSGSTKEANDEYKKFWKYTVGNNAYMCALLLKKAEKLYGSSDLCVKKGLSVLSSELEKNFTLDDGVWRLLAEIEMNFAYHIVEYTRNAVNNNMLKKSLRYLHYSNDLSNDIVFFLYSVIITPDDQFRRVVLTDLMSYKWAIEVSATNNKYLVSEIVNSFVRCNDVPSLINILDLCADLKFSEVSDKSQSEWKEYLLSLYQPISMILYRNILKREGLSVADVLDELYCFTSWQTNNSQYAINDYLFFSYAIAEFPEKYDYYSGFFNESGEAHRSSEKNDTELLSDNLSIGNAIGILSENSKKYINYLIVDKPFRTLILKNPDKVLDFLGVIGSISLYHDSRSIQYKKSLTWVDTSGYYLNDYKEYIDYIASKHSPAEVLYIYMNSPLKSMIDFTYLIRLLFMPEIGYTDLTAELEEYTFRGKLLKTSNSDTKLAYQVSISNVHSSYRFPIHHSWTSLHINDLENNFAEGDVIYFKIMSLNSRGMIFAYALAPKPHREKKEVQKKEVKSEAIKNFDRVKDGTLPLQGKNSEEKIRLYALAMICDNDNRILVETKSKNGVNTEYLPYLPISNNESSDNTIKRLLKYYIGFSGSISIAPCGIRHLCTGYDKRSIFFIYRILVSNIQELQKTLILKSSMNWRSIPEYKENIDDYISESFISALDVSWSELSLTT